MEEATRIPRTFIDALRARMRGMSKMKETENKRERKKGMIHSE